MSESIWIKGGLGVVLVLLLSACSSPGRPPPATTTDDTLFTLQPAQSRQALARTPGANAYLQTLLNDPATADIRLVDVEPLRVAAGTQSLAVPLPDGSTARFKLMRIDSSMPGMTGWIGDIPSDRKQRFTSPAEVGMDPFNWVSLLREGDKVVGSLHVAGQAYRLEPVGAGLHVLVKRDESKLPADGVEEADSAAGPAAPAAGANARSAHSFIRVLFVTTDQSRVKFPDNRLLIAQALQTANQFLINSEVAITYELAGFMDASYDETGIGYSEQLADLRFPDRPLGKAVYLQRDALAADLVAMLSSYTNVCGVGRQNADKANGYSSFSCIGASLAHELGHNLGARHEWKPEDGQRVPHYVHGYRRSMAPVFHTLMATSHGAIPYFSNPRLRYQDVPMGSSGQEDVARRFNERREVVENFYPAVLSVTLYEDEHFKGRTCSVALLGTAARFVAEACGAEWAGLVSSVKIHGITPGAHVHFSTPRSQGTESYHSTDYRGDLDIPAFAGSNLLPSGVSRSRTGATVNDKVDVIATWGGE